MLRFGHPATSGRPSPTGEGVIGPRRGRRGGSDRGLRRLRLVASVFGVLGAVLALAALLLPVIQDTTVITWPRAGRLAPVNAPLVTYQPQSLTATIPCSGEHARTRSMALW